MVSVRIGVCTIMISDGTRGRVRVRVGIGVCHNHVWGRVNIALGSGLGLG